MKKIIILSAISLSLFAASCRKARTCTCTSTTSTTTMQDFTNPSFPDQTTISTYSEVNTTTSDKMKKKDARRKYSCYSSTDTDTQVSNKSGGSTAYVETETVTKTETCELK